MAIWANSSPLRWTLGRPSVSRFFDLFLILSLKSSTAEILGKYRRWWTLFSASISVLKIKRVLSFSKVPSSTFLQLLISFIHPLWRQSPVPKTSIPLRGPINARFWMLIFLLVALENLEWICKSAFIIKCNPLSSITRIHCLLKKCLL